MGQGDEAIEVTYARLDGSANCRKINQPYFEPFTVAFGEQRPFLKLSGWNMQADNDDFPLDVEVRTSVADRGTYAPAYLRSVVHVCPSVQTYASNYTGHARISRLLFIADNAASTQMQLEALKIAAEEARQVRCSCPLARSANAFLWSVQPHATAKLASRNRSCAAPMKVCSPSLGNAEASADCHDANSTCCSWPHMAQQHDNCVASLTAHISAPCSCSLKTRASTCNSWTGSTAACA